MIAIRKSYLVAGLFLGACGAAGGDPGPTGNPPGPDQTAQLTCVAGKRTCADVMAAFAGQAADVKVSCDAGAGRFTLQATGVPNYTSNQGTSNAIKDQSWMVSFPLDPACAGSPADVVNSRGPVGFMVNGVPFYGPQDAQGRDAVVNEGKSFDDCAGHADPMCSYHYHEEPVCVFGAGVKASARTLADGHPPVIGFALDGFALYASYPAGTDKKYAALDDCGGHGDAARGYHYHARGSFPYLLACYRGKDRGTMMHTRAMCGM